MQGWDLALTVLRSYRDALPQASGPDAANGRVSVAMRHEDGLQQSAFSVTTHLVIVDVVATSYKGKDVCLHSELAGPCLYQDASLKSSSLYVSSAS